MTSKKIIIDKGQNLECQGTYAYPKEFEKAIVLDCAKSKTTFDDIRKVIIQAIDKKKPLIIESIDLVVT